MMTVEEAEMNRKIYNKYGHLPDNESDLLQKMHDSMIRLQDNTDDQVNE